MCCSTLKWTTLLHALCNILVIACCNMFIYCCRPPSSFLGLNPSHVHTVVLPFLNTLVINKFVTLLFCLFAVCAVLASMPPAPDPLKQFNRHRYYHKSRLAANRFQSRIFEYRVVSIPLFLHAKSSFVVVCPVEGLGLLAGGIEIRHNIFLKNFCCSTSWKHLV